MGFVIKSACEYECEYFHDGEIFTTLRKAINAVKLDAEWIDFFMDYDGEFYIINTETCDKIRYHYDGKKVKRIKLYKNEKPKYKVILCSGLSVDDKYYSTLRRSFEAMKSMSTHLGPNWYVLVNLETNEKKLYAADRDRVRREKDPFFINLYSKDLR